MPCVPVLKPAKQGDAVWIHNQEALSVGELGKPCLLFHLLRRAESTVEGYNQRPRFGPVIILGDMNQVGTMKPEHAEVELALVGTRLIVLNTGRAFRATA